MAYSNPITAYMPDSKEKRMCRGDEGVCLERCVGFASTNCRVPTRATNSTPTWLRGSSMVRPNTLVSGCDGPHSNNEHKSNNERKRRDSKVKGYETHSEESIEAMLVVESFFGRLCKVALKANLCGGGATDVT